jgi:hypothetical protein
VLRGLKTTAAHEFGHALGINGHSDNPSDVMFYGRQVNKPEDVPVSPRDLNTLRAAYAGLTATAARAAAVVQRNVNTASGVVTATPAASDRTPKSQDDNRKRLAACPAYVRPDR